MDRRGGEMNLLFDSGREAGFMLVPVCWVSTGDRPFNKAACVLRPFRATGRTLADRRGCRRRLVESGERLRGF